MKIACLGYRDWALRIYDHLEKNTDNDFLIIRSIEDYAEHFIIDFKPDLILFYGWSWIIPKNLTNNYDCVMLHPSKLPKYRGGSPLQNQILDGLKESSVTLFLVVEELDAGDILRQKDLSLTGSLKEIFARITSIGITLTEDILLNGLNPTPQNHELASYCKRRKPSESEITIDELQIEDSTYLYNKIRMLNDPYPNAYIKTRDGKKLILTESKIED